ncbi:trypsin-like peptidase domain-containing protein [Shewanella sp. HL-SH4]|uniref:trypsin-like peptidase domain-containing protein n=1 Tax=Shewanella sp. HL-SH4 TaxID=3436240 RepID=UPI003EBF6DD9
MTDYHKDVIFQVECNGKGTAFLISESLMMTAFHVVEDSEQGEEITLFNEKHGKVTGIVNKLITEDLKAIDIAVLDVSKNIVDSNYVKLAISEKFPEGVKWYTRGFISAKGSDGLNILPIGSNTITSSYDVLTEVRNNYDIDLSVEKEWDSYEGMSGSPFMVNGYAYGVITTEIAQGEKTKEITALSTRKYSSLIRDLGVKIIDKEILDSKPEYDTSANESYELINNYDPRSLSDKLKSVCQEIRKARIQLYSRSAVNSNIELDQFPKQRVNALKYRIFEACQKLLLTKIEHGLEPKLTVDQIEDILDEFSDEATKIIKELTMDYTYPIKNRESIKNAILSLIDDCYLAFDEEGLYEEN